MTTQIRIDGQPFGSDETLAIQRKVDDITKQRNDAYSSNEEMKKQLDGMKVKLKEMEDKLSKSDMMVKEKEKEAEDMSEKMKDMKKKADAALSPEELVAFAHERAQLLQQVSTLKTDGTDLDTISNQGLKSLVILTKMDAEDFDAEDPTSVDMAYKMVSKQLKEDSGKPKNTSQILADSIIPPGKGGTRNDNDEDEVSGTNFYLDSLSGFHVDAD